MVSQASSIVAGEAGKGNEIYGFSGQFKQYEGLVCDMQEYILSNGFQANSNNTKALYVICRNIS